MMAQLREYNKEKYTNDQYRKDEYYKKRNFFFA